MEPDDLSENLHQQQRLIGTWTYPGVKGPTRYSIKCDSSEGLVFEGRDGRGARLTGTLQRAGPWLQAELSRRSGDPAGTIRLAPTTPGAAVVSNFKGVGKVKWGKDIVAHPTDVPVATPTDRGQGPFTTYLGCISAGNDLLVAETTLDEAKAWCAVLDGCRGFCFQGHPDDREGVLKVYFKSKWDLVSLPSDGQTWTACRYEGASSGSADNHADSWAPTSSTDLHEWKEEMPDDLNCIPGRTCLWDLPSTTGPAPRLSKNAVLTYQQNWFIGPMRALTVDELEECRSGLDRYVSGHCKGILDNASSLLNHITLPWLYKLATHPRIVGAAASVLQCEDVLLFNSCMFLRSPGLSCKQELGVGWHQDGVLYNNVLHPMEDWVTAFVALSSCKQADGCLQYVPKRLVRGPGTEDRKMPYMEMGPGEFSLHNAAVTHRAGTNCSAHRRDCIALRYISGRVRDRAAEMMSTAGKDWVVCCSGKDTDHFRALPPPAIELGEPAKQLRANVAALRAARYGTTRFE